MSAANEDFQPPPPPHVTETPRAPRPTKLRPVAIALIVLGVIGKAKENLRKHLMHVAVLIGLAGCIIPAVRLLRMSEFNFNAAFFAQLGMSLVCLAFVILSVRSFINAR